jgi:HlyD family secretion protein
MKLKRPQIIALVLVLGLGGWFLWQKYQEAHFLYAGILEADEVDISPGVVSQIKDYAVKEGDPVKAGQPLVSLACEEVRIQAGQAATDFERAERLFKAGSMPKAEYDRMKTRDDEAQLQLSWCEIQAPSAGTVLSVTHRVGEWARPGMNLLTMADLAHLYAFVYVSKAELSKLKPGLAVEGFLPETGGKAYPGRIAFLRPDAEFTPKNVQTREQRERLVFGVKVAFDNPGGTLNPGLPIEVKLP